MRHWRALLVAPAARQIGDHHAMRRTGHLLLRMHEPARVTVSTLTEIKVQGKEKNGKVGSKEIGSVKGKNKTKKQIHEVS